MDLDPCGRSTPPRRGALRLATPTSGAATTLMIAALIALAPTPSNAQQPPVAPPLQTQPPLLNSLAPIVERVAPAVVNISVTPRPGRDRDDVLSRHSRPDFPGGGSFEEFLRRFFDGPRGDERYGPGSRPRAGEPVALGSGFIIDPAGVVVTTDHVLGKAAGDAVTVILQDESKHPATVLGRDEKTDLAVLKIEAPRPLPHVAWGDSDAVKVGDWVVAVGNPFGLGGTVTAGIVSARGRNLQAGPYDDFLQIDAPINRGNSGGPAFNIVGEVIGINAAIYSPSGGSVGIGFAIPSNLAKTVVAQLKEKGRVTRGWLGVQIQDLTPGLAKGLGLDPEHPRGALVADVTPGGPAERAGLKPGDVIVGLAGKPVDQPRTLRRRVAEAPVGTPLPVTVWRSGQEQSLQVSLDELREEQEAGTAGSAASVPPQARALGLRFEALDDEGRRQQQLRPDVQGVVVAEVAPGSPAASVVRSGDVIVSIDQQPVTAPAEAAQRLVEAAEARKGKPVLLQLYRRGESQFVAVPPVSGSDRG